MQRLPPQPIQYWVAGVYACCLVLVLIWAGRRAFGLGETRGLVLLGPVMVYLALLVCASVVMRPHVGHGRSFTALYLILVGLHAVTGLVSVAGLSVVSLKTGFLLPSWAFAAAVCGVLYGALSSQIMLFVAERALLYSLTNVGMLLCVLILAVLG